jgi:hypothetical protein
VVRRHLCYLFAFYLFFTDMFVAATGNEGLLWDTMMMIGR